MRIQRLWTDQRLRTLVLVNLASIMEKADEALLPGVYKEVGQALHTDLAALGSLTLLRSITQALCFPLAAYFSMHYDRAKVIAAGAFLWSVATFFVGVSSTFFQIAVSRALNGIGLALVVPAIQSLVADASDDSNRGTAFGWLQFTTSFGTILGGFLSVLLAATTFLGIAGWRLSFFLVTIVSVIIGILLLAFAVDPKTKTQNERGFSTIWAGLKEAIEDGRQVLNIKTFQILVAQGVVGNFPGAALAFAPLWLELKGFSHTQTAFLLGLYTASGSIGGLFGGYMGDVLSRVLPNAGRITLSQISSGSGVPLAALLLLGLPYRSSTALLHAVVFFVLGFFTSWNAPATNNPIFAEIVPEKSRTSVYALDRSFETVLSSFAPPLVGILAEKLYGYVPPSPTAHEDITVNKADAVSLGKALYTSYSIPMTLCCLTYSFLYCTYPKDRDSVRAREAAGIAISDEGGIGLVSLSKVAYEKSQNGYFLGQDEEADGGDIKDSDEAQRVLLEVPSGQIL